MLFPIVVYSPYSYFSLSEHPVELPDMFEVKQWIVLDDHLHVTPKGQDALADIVLDVTLSVIPVVGPVVSIGKAVLEGEYKTAAAEAGLALITFGLGRTAKALTRMADGIHDIVVVEREVKYFRLVRTVLVENRGGVFFREESVENVITKMSAYLQKHPLAVELLEDAAKVKRVEKIVDFAENAKMGYGIAEKLGELRRWRPTLVHVALNVFARLVQKRSSIPVPTVRVVPTAEVANLVKTTRMVLLWGEEGNTSQFHLHEDLAAELLASDAAKANKSVKETLDDKLNSVYYNVKKLYNSPGSKVESGEVDENVRRAYDDYCNGLYDFTIHIEDPKPPQLTSDELTRRACVGVSNDYYWCIRSPGDDVFGGQ